MGNLPQSSKKWGLGGEQVESHMELVKSHSTAGFFISYSGKPHRESLGILDWVLGPGKTQELFTLPKTNCSKTPENLEDSKNFQNWGSK